MTPFSACISQSTSPHRLTYKTYKSVMQPIRFGARLTLTVVLFLLFLIRAAAATQDDLVPSGIFNYSVSTTHEEQYKAVARDSVTHDLTVYALPDPTYAGQVSGTLSREYTETDLRLQYGITDTWNLALTLPYVVAIQRSTLQVTNPNADPILFETVASLQNKTLSGMGNYRLESIHRPIFRDENAVTFGYGITGSTERNEGIYTGVSSFEIRDPYGTWLAFLHYTHYPNLARSRFDMRVEYDLPQIDHVNLPTGERGASLLGGPTYAAYMEWEHEPGAWGYALRLQGKATQDSRIDGVSQDDPITELLFHAQISFGNLIALEQAPISFPYQVSLTWDTTLAAYNAPIRDRWGFQFSGYF